MEEIYGNIAKRTGGNIYVGVVGPVRTGKSTLIKRMMETLIIPNIEDNFRRERAKDELPQSGSGKTIMTAEPKFVPEEAVEVSFPGEGRAMVRFIDSVGYMVDGAIGTTEDGRPRMVTTPWYDHEITMEEAAREGTDRIISDHSTIGLLVTTDGSITDIPRQAYLSAEEKTHEVLRRSGIPYVIVLNSREPGSEQCMALKAQLEKKYGASVFPCDCQNASDADLNNLLAKVLYEFPVTEIGIWMPSWVNALGEKSPVRARLFALVRDNAGEVKKLSDIQGAIRAIAENEDVESAELLEIDAGTGAAKARINLPRAMFYNTLSGETGLNIRDDGDLVHILTSLADVKQRYDRIAGALDEVRATGYGIVMPDADEMVLEEPEIIRQGGRYGVKLRASAPSIHMMLTDIKTEVSPIVGDEKQSEELLNYIMQEFDGDRSKLWESNIFGKSLHDLVNEGLTAKLRRLPTDARGKFQGTLEKVINDGSGTLICIML